MGLVMAGMPAQANLFGPPIPEANKGKMSFGGAFATNNRIVPSAGIGLLGITAFPVQRIGGNGQYGISKKSAVTFELNSVSWTGGSGLELSGGYKHTLKKMRLSGKPAELGFIGRFGYITGSGTSFQQIDLGGGMNIRAVKDVSIYYYGLLSITAGDVKSAGLPVILGGGTKFAVDKNLSVGAELQIGLVQSGFGLFALYKM